MISKQFIEILNKTITLEGRSLMTEFFITFSRFEFALKASNFANGNNERVTANWDTFIASVAINFNPDKNEKLKNAVEYLLQHPPRVQMIDSGHLGWRDRLFQVNELTINKLSLSIRDIRNNLFHGGKFNGLYQEDVSRNYILLKSSITILNDWLGLNDIVRRNFSAPLS